MLVATRILPAAIKPGKQGSKAAPHYRQDSTRLTPATDLPTIHTRLTAYAVDHLQRRARCAALAKQFVNKEKNRLIVIDFLCFTD